MTQKVKYLTTDLPGCTHLKVKVWYDKGEYVLKRGYHMSVQPVHREDKGTYTVESFTPAKGVRLCLLEATRFSKKKFEEVVSESQGFEMDLIKQVINLNT